MTARLTFSRTSPDDVGVRQVFVSVDGRQAAVLVHGREATVDLPPGDHRIRIHNTLVWKTIAVTLTPGEHVRYAITNRAGFGTMALIATLGVGPIYLSVVRDAPPIATT